MREGRVTDLGNGIHLSTVAERRWQPDLDIGGQADLVVDDEGTTAGLWRADPDIGGVARRSRHDPGARDDLRDHRTRAGRHR